MKLHEDHLSYRHEGANSDLIIPIDAKPSVEHDKTMENVRINSRLDIPWLNEIKAKIGTAIICGAGPSLKNHIQDIKQSGGIVFAVNSAAQYLISKGVQVHYQVILDPLPEEIDELAEADEHLIASIADPAVFKAVKRPILWHPLIAGIEDEIPAGKLFCGIGGGITVTNSTLCIAYTMGFHRLKVYGVDSSYKDGHRYADQGKAPPGALAVDIELDGRKYATSYDLKLQVNLFMMLAALLDREGVEVEVFGEGLLPDLFREYGNSPERRVVYDLISTPPAYGEYMLTLMFARYGEMMGNKFPLKLVAGEKREDWAELPEEKHAGLIAEFPVMAQAVLKNGIELVESVDYRYPAMVYSVASQKLNKWLADKPAEFLDKYLLTADDFKGHATIPDVEYVTMGARYSKYWETHRNLTNDEFLKIYSRLVRRFPLARVMVVSDQDGCDHFREVAKNNGIECLFSKDYSDSFTGDAELILRSKFFYMLRGGGIGIVPMFSRLPYEMHFDPMFHGVWSETACVSWATKDQVYSASTKLLWDEQC